VSQTQTKPPLYERGLQLAEAGQSQEALRCIQEYLLQAPEDAEALNDAGALLYSLGRLDEATEHLKQALAHTDGPRAPVLWNLAEVHLDARRPQAALELADAMEAEGILSADLLNRAARGLLEADDRAGAVEALLRSLQFSPRQEALPPILQKAKDLRPKVAFFCETRQTAFVQDTLGFLEPRFPTRYFEGTDKRAFIDTLNWCDIAWFEWCTGQVVFASKLPKVCRSIVRLRRYEAYAPWPQQVRWENIDVLALNGNHVVRDRLRSTVPDIEQRTRIVEIPNGICMERFAFVNRPRGKNLAFIANLRMVKNPMLLLQCFHKLHQADPEYRLSVAGSCYDEVLYTYLQEMVQELDLGESVSFDGWQGDIPAWLADKHYLISTSVIEGHPFNVLEAMACGLKPVLHTFPGARDFFPDEYLFRTVDEFCGRILDDPYEPAAYRRFVEDRFPLRTYHRRVDELFREFERNPIEQKYPIVIEDRASGAGKDVSADDPASDSAYYDRRFANGGPPGNYYAEARSEAICAAVGGLGRQDLRILELGCGRGQLAADLAAFGHVTGVDWSSVGVEAAGQACPEGEFLCGDFFEVELPAESFDVVVSEEVVEHLAGPRQLEFLRIARRALTAGGLLVLTTPNRPVAERANEAFRRHTGHDWSEQPSENHLTCDELSARLEEAGFAVQSVETIVPLDNVGGLHICAVATKS